MLPYFLYYPLILIMVFLIVADIQKFIANIAFKQKTSIISLSFWITILVGTFMIGLK